MQPEQTEAPPQAETPTTIVVDAQRYAVLQARSSELDASLKVTAVIAERLMKHEGGDSLIIDDATWQKSPSMRAWRVLTPEASESKGHVVIVIERDEPQK